MAALARAPAMKGGGEKKLTGCRLLSVAVGCFVFFLVFALSSRYDAAVVLHTRRGDFRPRQGESHRDGELKQQLSLQSINVAREADLGSGSAPATPNSDEQAKPGYVFQNCNDAIEAAEDAHQDKSSAAGTTAQTTSPQHEHPGDIMTRAAAGHQQRQPLCDLSGPRADVCDLTGDVRMVANASAFVVVVDPAAGGANGPTYRVRPYARKGDATSMGRVTEVTVRTTAAAPRCTATHAEPAVVFSIGGYAGNLFHDFTDVLVPLYGAARRYGGDARLVVADAGSSRWLLRYGAVLRGLSRHAPLDLAVAAAAGEVHCFRRAVVGLRAHRELMLEPERGPDADGTMAGFTRFLRRALSLPRDAPTRPGGGKPRLLVVARRGTRRLLNAGAVARVAAEVGFEAVVEELPVSRDVAQVGRRINSFDAVVGVHGAGLTNMVFLPPGAAVVQVVPWGGLQWIARLDFGDPADAMGLRYIQYEIAVHESSLRDKYPRDHEIFTNPTALHRKGFKFLRHTFLIGQDVTIDVDRFRPVLLKAFQNLTQ